ncbi:DUF2977 domain-containing protein [Liquorilactobacillus aquaticus]|nr:DUF2977 domain-containing protein [Liquorilactobacillus aquaticus]
MQLQLDSDNNVIGYADIGTISDGVDYEGDIPDDFYSNFKNYKLEDGNLV